MRRGSILVSAMALVTSMVVLGAVGEAGSPYGTVPINGYHVNGKVYATKIVGDTLYVGGEFTAAISPAGASVSRMNLAAFRLSDGMLLPLDIQPSGRVRAIDHANGTLWIGGDFNTVSGNSRRRLAGIDIASSTVTPFSIYMGSNVHAIVATSTQLYVGGVFSYVSGIPQLKVARINIASASLDTTWAPQPDGHVFTLAMSPTGNSIFMGGNFTNVGATPRRYAAEISTATGQPTSRIVNETDPVLALDVDPSGDRIYTALGGLSNAADGIDATTGNRIWRHRTDGDVQAIRYYDGNVYFGFHDGFKGNQSVKILCADPANGIIDGQWQVPVQGFWGVFSISASPTRLAVGGLYDTIGGLAKKNIALLPITTPSVRYIAYGANWAYSAIPGSTLGNPALPKFGENTSWPTGNGQLGYGDGDEHTVLNYGPTKPPARFSTTFSLAAVPGTEPTLNIIVDDGAAVWINGTEVARINLPAGQLTTSTRPINAVAGSAETTPVSVSVPTSALHSGANLINVAVFNHSSSSSDLSFDLELRE